MRFAQHSCTNPGSAAPGPEAGRTLLLLFGRTSAEAGGDPVRGSGACYAQALKTVAGDLVPGSRRGGVLDLVVVGDLFYAHRFRSVPHHRALVSPVWSVCSRSTRVGDPAFLQLRAAGPEPRSVPARDVTGAFPGRARPGVPARRWPGSGKQYPCAGRSGWRSR